MKKEKIEEFLNNNTICEVRTKSIIENNYIGIIVDFYLILKSTTNNEIEIPAYDFLVNNNNIRNKIILDFDKLFNEYYARTKDVVIKRNMCLFSSDEKCYGININTKPDAQLCFFDEGYKHKDKEDELIEITVNSNLNLGMQKIKYKPNMIEEVILKAFDNILLDHLNRSSEKAFSSTEIYNKFIYKESLNLNDINVSVYDTTFSCCGSDKITYVDDVKKHNEQIDEAKKMQMKFNGM